MKKVLISAVIVLIGLFVMYSASDSALLEKFQDNLNAILSLGYEEKFEIISEEEALQRFPEEVVKIAKAWVVAGGFPDYPAYRHPGQPDDVELSRHMMVKKGSNVLWVGVSYNLTSGSRENVKLVPQYKVGVDFGKLIERLNETDYRVTLVYCAANKYLVMSFNLSVNKSSEYFLSSDPPIYYILNEIGVGKWRVADYSGSVKFYTYTDPNEVDNRIIQTLASNIKRFAEENELNNSQVVLLTCGFINTIMEYNFVHFQSYNELDRIPCKVAVYDKGIIKTVNLTITDSIIKRDLLEGGVCWDRSELAASILSELGIRAFSFTEHSQPEFGPKSGHAEVGVDIRDVDLSYIQGVSPDKEHIPVVINLSINDFNLAIVLIHGSKVQMTTHQDLNKTNNIHFFIHGTTSKKLYSNLLKV